MADLTGFNFTNLKRNLIAPGTGIDWDPLKADYLRWAKASGTSIPGITDRSRDLALQALEAGHQVKDIAALHDFKSKKKVPFGEVYGKNEAEYRRISDHINERLDNAISSAVDAGEFIGKEFNQKLVAQSREIAGKASKSDVELAASKIGDKINEDFAARFGRPPTQGETAAFFNQMSYGQLGTPHDETSLTKLINSSNLEQTFQSFESKLPIIEQANLQLKNIGGELNSDQITQLLSKGLSPEKADVLASNIVQQLTDADAKAKLAEVAPKRMAAIGELNTALARGQAEFLSGDITNAVVTALRNRGLPPPGPELSNVLAEIGGKLNREREAIIAPLRAQTALEAPQAAFDFALRGAAESGRKTGSAIDFLRNIGVMREGQSFTATQGALDRLFKSQESDKQTALLLASMGRQPDRPGALDYFLQYGLPVIGQVAGGYLSRK